MAGLAAYAAAGALAGAGQGIVERARALREEAMAAQERADDIADMEQRRAWQLEDKGLSGGSSGGGRRSSGGSGGSPGEPVEPGEVSAALRAAGVRADASITRQVEAEVQNAIAAGLGKEAAIADVLGRLDTETEVTNPAGTMLTRGLHRATGGTVGTDPAGAPDQARTVARGIRGGSEAPAEPPRVADAPAMPSDPSLPQIGDEREGDDGVYRFKGGDQYDRGSWEKVSARGGERLHLAGGTGEFDEYGQPVGSKEVPGLAPGAPSPLQDKQPFGAPQAPRSFREGDAYGQIGSLIAQVMAEKGEFPEDDVVAGLAEQAERLVRGGMSMTAAIQDVFSRRAPDGIIRPRGFGSDSI